MTPTISAEDDRLLEEAVSSGHFRDKQEALSEALRLLREKISEQNGVQLSADAWRERFREHLQATPVSGAITVDTSRESIYEGRGE